MDPPIREPYLSPFARVEAAAIALADADAEDDGEYQKARERLRSAVRAYAGLLTPKDAPPSERLLQAAQAFMTGRSVPPPVEVSGGGDAAPREQAAPTETEVRRARARH